MLVKDILQKYNITQLRKIVKRSNISSVNKYSKDDLIKEMIKPRHKPNFSYLKALKHDTIENRKKNIALVDKDLNVDKEKRKVKREENKKKKAEELRAKVPALTERKTAKKAVKISQFGPDKPPRGKKEQQKIKKIVKKTQFGPDKPPREKKDKPSVKKLIDLLVPKDKRAKKTDKKESLEEKKKLLQKLKDIIKKTKEPPKKADKDVKKKKYIDELKELGKKYQTARRGFTAKDPLRLQFKKIENLLGDIESKNISKKVKSTKDIKPKKEKELTTAEKKNKREQLQYVDKLEKRIKNKEVNSMFYNKSTINRLVRYLKNKSKYLTDKYTDKQLNDFIKIAEPLQKEINTDRFSLDVEGTDISDRVKKTKNIKPKKKESEIDKTRKLISKSDIKKFIASQFTVKQAKLLKEEYEPSDKFEKKYLVDIAKKLGYGSKAINKSRDNNYNFIINKLKIDDLVKKVKPAKKFKEDPRFTIGLTEAPKKEEQKGKEEKVKYDGKDYFTRDKGETFYTISKKLNKKRKIDIFLNKKVQAKYKGIEIKEEKQPIKLNKEQLIKLKGRLELTFNKRDEMIDFYKELGSVAPNKIPDFKEITKKKEKVVLKDLPKKKEEKKEPKKEKKEPKKEKKEPKKDDTLPEGIFDEIDSDEDEFEREVRLKREKEAKKKKKKEEKKKKEPKKEKKEPKKEKKEGKKPKYTVYKFKTKKLEDFDVYNEIPGDLTKEEKKDLLFILEETPIYTHSQEVTDFIKDRKKPKETKQETKKQTIKDDIPEGIFDEIDSDEDEFERELRLKREKEKKKNKKKSKN